MRRRAFVLATAAMASFQALTQSSRPARIGVIVHSTTYMPSIEGLRAGLKELGVMEGRDITLDVVNATGDVRRIEEAARRFEREKVLLVFCTPTTTTTIVKRVTTSVPVVFMVGTDPVASGFVASYAQPGGRLTGVHYLTTDLTGKRLELLKDLLPKLHRVVTIYTLRHGPAEASARVAREAGKRLGIEVIERTFTSRAELLQLIAALKPGEADAYLWVSDAAVAVQVEALIAKTRAIRLPMIVYDEEIAEQGALVSYGVDTREAGRESAKHVQRILGGARPAEVPVENVTRLRFVLNRRTANELHITVPPAMIVRFDRVIE